jgi:hypothetical protein
VTAFPKTRAAAGYAARHGPGELTRARAAIVLARLDACEGLLPGGDGDVPAVLRGLLRDLALAARDLAGPAWLEAASDDPDIAAFTALQATPAPAGLDEVVSRMLWARFGPPGAARDDTGPGRPASPAANGEDRRTAPGGTRARHR